MGQNFSSILVVDNNPDNLNVLSDLLDKRGFEVLFVLDGETALERAQFIHPDLILLNVMMPGMNGFETCRRLKADAKTKDVPVIFMSALCDTDDKIRGFEVGADDYVTKPIEPEEMLARIKTHLKIRQLQNVLKAQQAALLEKQAQLDKDLFAAAQIQQSLIPKTPPVMKNFRFAWQFMPCEQVGGDLFNIEPLDESHLAIYLLDVSGHGFSSAMVTVSVSQMLRPRTGSILKRKLTHAPYYEIVSPVDVLNSLEQEYPLERFRRYFTMVYLILNIKTGAIRYGNAAHPMPVLVRAEGEIVLLEERGSAIGMGGAIPLVEGEVIIQPGDRLFLYTDGIVECRNKTNELYDEQRLYDELLKYRQEPLETVCARVIDALMVYRDGIHQQDDITLVAVECQRELVKDNSVLTIS